MSDAPDLPWVYLPRRTRVASYTAAAIVLVVFTAGAVVFPAFGSDIWSVTDSIGLVGVAVVIAGVALFLGRPRLICEERGLTVVNLFGTRSLEWSEIVHIAFRPGDPWISLDLVEGETLPVMALQSSGGDRFRAGLAAFRALVATHSPR